MKMSKYMKFNETKKRLDKERKRKIALEQAKKRKEKEEQEKLE